MENNNLSGEMGFPLKIYLATNNAHKAEEIAAIITSLGVTAEVASALELGGMPDVEETGDTFLANARIKAWELAKKAPREHILADDSGLEVEALDGAPGIHTARYAGVGATAADNKAKLLKALEGLPIERRKARFYCCLVLLVPVSGKLEEQVFEGFVEGYIAESESGTGGFGYDPIFIPLGYNQTLSELDPEEKNEISHRGVAMRRLGEWVRGLNP